MQAFEDVNIVASPQGVQSIKRQIKSQKGSKRKVPKKYANDPELKESYEKAVLQIPDISKDELTLGPEDQKILFRRTGVPVIQPLSTHSLKRHCVLVIIY